MRLKRTGNLTIYYTCGDEERNKMKRRAEHSSTCDRSVTRDRAKQSLACRNELVAPQQDDVARRIALSNRLKFCILSNIMQRDVVLSALLELCRTEWTDLG